MKTLLLANQKGGVGKSTLVCQLAYYLTEKLDLRVLVIDTDAQANTTKALRTGGIAVVSETAAARVFAEQVVTVEDAKLVVLPATDALKKLEQLKADHNTFAGNFKNFLGSVQGFDVCLIDTNPFPDIRVIAAMVAADHIVSPVQLNQEAIDGIGALIADVKRIKQHLNPTLNLIGILPNQVQPTPFQKANFAELSKHFGKLLISLGEGRFAAVKSTTSLPEAQAAGLPVWRLGKTSAREAWKEMEPAFAKIATDMGVNNNVN